jgi:hypothetical protein
MIQATGACTENHFTAVMVPFHIKLVFANNIHFYPSLIFAGKAGAYQSGAL